VPSAISAPIIGQGERRLPRDDGGAMLSGLYSGKADSSNSVLPYLAGSNGRKASIRRRLRRRMAIPPDTQLELYHRRAIKAYKLFEHRRFCCVGLNARVKVASCAAAAQRQRCGIIECPSAIDSKPPISKSAKL
jgi:hypothetical protein